MQLEKSSSGIDPGTEYEYHCGLEERIDKDLQPLQDRIDIKTYSYAIRHYHEKQGIIIPIL